MGKAEILLHKTNFWRDWSTLYHTLKEAHFWTPFRTFFL